MDRKTIDAILETVADMITHEHVEPFVVLLDVLLIHLAARGALDPAALAKQLSTALQGVDLATQGARVMLRTRYLCEILSGGPKAKERAQAFRRKNPDFSDLPTLLNIPAAQFHGRARGKKKP